MSALDLPPGRYLTCLTALDLSGNQLDGGAVPSLAAAPALRSLNLLVPPPLPSAQPPRRLLVGNPHPALQLPV